MLNGYTSLMLNNMKRLLLFTILLYSGHLFFVHLYGQEICGTDEALGHRLQALGLTYEEYFEKIAQKTQERLDAEHATQDDYQIYYIPVVFHILHQGGAIGAGYNISKARIDRQMEVLNKAYAEAHSGVADIRGIYQPARAGDTRIRFSLASKDPTGQPTDGITRTQMREGGKDLKLVNMPHFKSPWNTSKYLNVWTIPSQNLYGWGEANYPCKLLDELEGEVPASADGVVVATETVMGSVASLDLGEGDILVHEIGHYLGLLHTFIQGCNVNGDDWCEDTPYQYRPTRSDWPCDRPVSSCRNLHMVENYMDYSSNACMLMFTACQRDRMRSYLSLDRCRTTVWTGAQDRISDIAIKSVSVSVRSATSVALNLISYAQVQVYWVVVDKADAPPNLSQIHLGNNALNAAAIANGKASLHANRCQSIDISNLRADVPYTVYFFSENASGNTHLPTSYSFTINSNDPPDENDDSGCARFLSTPHMSSYHKIRMYPNPASGTIQFAALSATESYAYKIYTVTGMLMRSGTLHNSDAVDISNLPRGQYVVALYTKAGKEVLRSSLMVR